jgi:hypothetical protein
MGSGDFGRLRAAIGGVNCALLPAEVCPLSDRQFLARSFCGGGSTSSWRVLGTDLAFLSIRSPSGKKAPLYDLALRVAFD